MKRTILIADDDQGFVQVLSIRLEQSGYDVLSVYEGIRAVEMANKRNPDLII